MFKKIMKNLLLVVLTVAILGCGAQQAGDKNKDVEESKSNMAKSAEGPQIMIYDLSEEPPTIDPQLNSKSQGSTIIGNLFEGLTRTDKDYNILPGMASHWDVSDDGLTYTFYLRDTKWSDGKDVTSNDFIFAWQRAILPETGAKYASQLFSVKNGQKVYNGTMDVSELGVRAIDDKTLEMTLEAPISYILELIADSVYMPVREDIVSKNPDSWSTTPENCVSNGPFKLVEHVINDKMRLVPNENYWDSERVQLDELKFTFILDETTRLSAFEAGEIDGFAGVPTQDIPRLKIESSEFYILPGFSTYHNPFNVNKYPMDNAKVREAMVKSIDRETIINTVLMGAGAPASGFVPKGLILNGEDFREAGGDYGILPTAQIELAQGLLSEAGFPNGEGWPKGVEYVFKASGTNQKIAEVLQEMWKQNLNIDINLVVVEGKVESERRRSGNHYLSRSGWGGDYYSPMTFLDIFTSYSGNNSTGYNNPEFDRLIEAAKLETDLAKSLELMHQAENLALGQYIVNPVYYPTKNVMMKDYVKNWGVPPMGPVLFDEVEIVKQEK